jgi:phospholipid transport system substrate-binding protein
MKQMLLATALAVGAAWSGPGRAEEPAIAFVRQIGSEMPAVLANAHTLDEKRARLAPFVSRVVDVDAVARYCLGHYWARATASQQQEYEALFRTVLINTIALWSGDYQKPGGNTSVTMQTPVVKADGTYVPTLVQAGDAPPVHITWVVAMNETPPRMLDVMAEGLSVRVTERSDYVSFLSHHDGNIDSLIQILRQRARDTGGTLAAAGRH